MITSVGVTRGFIFGLSVFVTRALYRAIETRLTQHTLTQVYNPRVGWNVNPGYEVFGHFQCLDNLLDSLQSAPSNMSACSHELCKFSYLFGNCVRALDIKHGVSNQNADLFGNCVRAMDIKYGISNQNADLFGNCVRAMDIKHGVSNQNADLFGNCVRAMDIKHGVRAMDIKHGVSNQNAHKISRKYHW
ncbi:hypothetical protein CHS0354_001668 [Potamilus streckersoni]|uniref:Uncharacterized protein n=1 Tax=Potamilus streckersoni TaxID=2493646 RepID=A0AAE0VKA8_9BIVA|nr:hypothetical protein CHS0354_001668 [Potamilus streckersoni]